MTVGQILVNYPYSACKQFKFDCKMLIYWNTGIYQKWYPDILEFGYRLGFGLDLGLRSNFPWGQLSYKH